MTVTWRPQTFTNFHRVLKEDPVQASADLDFTLQAVSTQAIGAANIAESLQPSGGITRNRPANPPLYTPFWDTTLNKVIYFQGRGVWKDAMGTTV